MHSQAFTMEEENTLKHRILTTKNPAKEDDDSGNTDKEANKEDKRNKTNMAEDEDENDKKQIEYWKKYKAMSFLEKYRLEKSSRVPAVR